jgi:hypothetical protein
MTNCCHLLGCKIWSKGKLAMKMPAVIDSPLFAPCGMNCMVCYRHLLTRKKQPACPGCSGLDLDKPEHCRNCLIKQCGLEKGHVYCFECADFPCKRIKNLDLSYRKRYETSLIENSQRVKQNGLLLFLEQELENWKCSTCAGVISIHDKTCSECGANKV